jgi:YVTN family beta-propeller protein
MSTTRLLAGLSALAVLPLASCSSYDFAAEADYASDTGAWGAGGGGSEGGDGWGDADADTDTDADADWDTGDYDDGYDREEEGAVEALRPAATDAYLFIANPDRSTLTRIDATDLSVITTPVGSDPSVVRTTPDGQTVLVLNKASETVSVIDADTLETQTIGLRPRLNRLEVSPDGRWSISWHDLAYETEADANPDGTTSYNEVSLVDVENRAHVPMVVGFNPRDVAFSADGSRAVVVSDTWLAILDLTQDVPAPERVRLAFDTVEPPEAEEVLITPDGDKAFIRQYGTTFLTVVDLVTGELQRIDVGDNATDLDLSPDGAHAVVVARASHELWVFDAADPFATPEVIALPPDEVFGALEFTPDGTQGILYTTASGLPGRYGAWTVGDPDIVVRPLVKPVHDVKVSPTGGTVLFVHDDEEETGVATSSPFRGAWTLSVVDTATHFANPVRLAAEPTGFAHGTDGSFGAFVMGGYRYLEVVDYRSLLFDEVSLKSPATNVGVLPGTATVYASQAHPLGRISFYDVSGKGLTTITGFELNSGIEIE